MRELSQVQNILVNKPEGKRPPGNLEREWRMILK